jgi:hypothetical protein
MSGAVIGTSGAVALGAGAASAVGAGVSAYANNQALRKQDRIAADSIRQQGQIQNQANDVVRQTIQKNATEQQANLKTNQQKQAAQYLDALRRAAPVQNGSTPAVAGASKAYADAAASAQKDNVQFGRTLAGQTAATDAPQLTQLQTQEGLGDAATQLGMLNDTSNRQANVARLREQSITANPWLTAAGQFISGAGAGLASSAGGKKKALTNSGTGIMADNGLGTSLGMNA